MHKTIDFDEQDNIMSFVLENVLIPIVCTFTGLRLKYMKRSKKQFLRHMYIKLFARHTSVYLSVSSASKFLIEDYRIDY